MIACAIAAGAARGLGHAHELRDEAGAPLGVVHRDVSPHNVFVTRDGEVKVLDFGIAKARSRLLETRSGLGRGKVAYFAPEQLVGAPLDARSDLFSLGTVLWEMLVGRPLWDRQQDDLTARAIRQDPAPPPADARRAQARAVQTVDPMSSHLEVSDAALAALDALVLRLLSKFPTTRPAHARDVAVELERIAAELVGGARVAPIVAALVARCAPAPGAGASR
ncbi:MAG: protein kinase [Polyangiaceae bacterium]